MPRTYPPAVERFWAMVQKGDGCWLWMGTSIRKGYGRFYPAHHRPVFAHRFSFALANGPIPDGMMVRHSCDNPRCVRPDHLLLGTGKDNARDAIERGRLHRGEGNHKSKLTAEQIRRIRAMHVPGKFGCRKIAELFGISRKQAHRIVSRQNWTHVS